MRDPTRYGSLKIYACQTDIVWEDKTANFAHVRRLLDDVRPDPGALIVLPEMFATGFSMNADAIAEDPGTGETIAFLSELACHFACPIIAGVVTRDSPDTLPRNEALWFAPTGDLSGRYAKQRPFTPGGERDHYAPGKTAVVWDIAGLKIAPLICYDLRFPELFRESLDQGAEAFVLIASWPGARIQHWSALLKARAIENQAYVIGVNRRGEDPAPLSYPGKSGIFAPSGDVLQEADDSETVLVTTIDVTAVHQYRESLPFLQDRVTR